MSYIYTWSVRKVSDRNFLCEHLMDYNLARLHEPTLKFVRMREFFPACRLRQLLASSS